MLIVASDVEANGTTAKIVALQQVTRLMHQPLQALYAAQSLRGRMLTNGTPLTNDDLHKNKGQALQ